MSGLAVVLGGDRSPQEVRIQLAGHGHRIEANALREAMRADSPTRELFLRYVLAALSQTANTVLANARAKPGGAARAVAADVYDQVDGDHLQLTHEFLSIMLRVRRAGVTVAIHMLEGRGFIRATRGRVQILDRGGLEVAAGGVYGLAEAEYARLIARPVGSAEPAERAARFAWAPGA